MMELTELSLRLLSLLTLLAALVFVVGIVWRVEAELDTAYKWFTLAVLFLLVSELIEVLPGLHAEVWGSTAILTARFLAAATLFLGMYFMRDLVRRMDGEKSERKKP